MVCQTRIRPPGHFAFLFHDEVRRLLFRNGLRIQQWEFQEKLQAELQPRDANRLRCTVRRHVQVIREGVFDQRQHVIRLCPGIPAQRHSFLCHDRGGSEYRCQSVEQETENSVEDSKQVFKKCFQKDTCHPHAKKQETARRVLRWCVIWTTLCTKILYSIYGTKDRALLSMLQLKCLVRLR